MKLLKLRLLVFKLLDIMKTRKGKIHFKMEGKGVALLFSILDVWCFAFMLLCLVDQLKLLIANHET